MIDVGSWSQYVPAKPGKAVDFHTVPLTKTEVSIMNGIIPCTFLTFLDRMWVKTLLVLWLYKSQQLL